MFWPFSRTTFRKACAKSNCLNMSALSCREQVGGGLNRSDYESSLRLDNVKLSFNDALAAPVVEWWAEDLAVLRFDFFQRVLAAMRVKGLRCESIGGAVMHYAHRALKGIHKRQIMKSPKPQVLIILLNSY